MSAALVWTVLKTWGGRLLALVPGLPKEAWMVLGALAFLAYFGHWNAERGRSEVRAEVAAAVAAERARVQDADRKAIEAAEQRAETAEKAAAQRGKELIDVYISAHDMPGAADICVPADIADRLRDLR